MWSMNILWFCFVIMILVAKSVCKPVSANFNASLRDYSVKEDIINTTAVKTLQKEELGRYANFAPARNPIVFKDVPDNELSSSSYSRGLLHHEQGGYGLHEYDDSPHHGYGYEYHLVPDHNYDHHGGHGGDHHGHHGHFGGHGHHIGFGHHHKHFDPTLAAKAFLWPVAGIALLGAAAALVSNPVLLQLGVISGRKRRDTEEVSGPDFDVTSLETWKPDAKTGPQALAKVDKLKSDNRKYLKGFKDRNKKVLSKVYPIEQSTIRTVKGDEPFKKDFDDSYVPVVLKTKST